MLMDGKTDAAIATHKVARVRAEAFGFSHRRIEVAQLLLEDPVRRFAAISDLRTPVAVETAVLGGVDRPWVEVSEAFEITATRSRPLRSSATRPDFGRFIDNALLPTFQHPAGVAMRVEAAASTPAVTSLSVSMTSFGRAWPAASLPLRALAVPAARSGR